MPGEGFQGPKCGAQTRQGGPCQQPAVSGGSRCRMHGGRSLKGVAHPNYKHGRYSDYMPEKLLHGYRRQLSDRNLLHQRDEIAAVDAMLFEALEKMSDDDSPGVWVKLRRLWREAVEASDGGDARAAATKMSVIDELIRRGADYFDQREDVLYLIERRRRLVDSQSRREVQERLMISYEDAAAMYRDLADAIHDVVTDKAQVRAIAERFAEITGTVIYADNDAN